MTSPIAKGITALADQLGVEWEEGFMPSRRVPTARPCSGGFECDSRLEPRWREIVDRAFEATHQLASVKGAVAEVEGMLRPEVRDGDFRFFGGQHGTPAIVFCALVEAVFSALGNDVPDDRERLALAIDDGIKQLEEFAAADHHSAVHVAPLIHVLPRHSAVRVTDRLTLSSVDDTRICEIWARAGVPADETSAESFMRRQRLLETSAQLELTVDVPLGEPYLNWAPAQMVIDRCVQSLRFIGPGDVHELSQWVEYPRHGWFLERLSPGPLIAPVAPPHPVRSADLSVGEKDAVEVHSNLAETDRLAEVELHRFEVAHRRFQSIYRRQNDEDRLIDAWIAIEALFLADKNQGELTFRAQMRVAQFTGDGQEDKEAIRETLQRSYGMRSNIVHGAKASKRKPEAVAKVTTETVDILRRALRRWISPDAERDMEAVERSMLA